MNLCQASQEFIWQETDFQGGTKDENKPIKSAAAKVVVNAKIKAQFPELHLHNLTTTDIWSSLMLLTVNVNPSISEKNDISPHLTTQVAYVWDIYDFLSQVWLVSSLHLASAWARWERRPDSWLNSSTSSMRLWWNLSSWSCGWYHLRTSLTHCDTHLVISSQK